MAHYRATIATPTEATAAFDYIADFANVAEWDPGVSSAEQSTQGPIGIGSTFRVVVQSAGRSLPFTYRVTAHEHPRTVTFFGTYGSMVSEDTVEVQPLDEGGCRVTYDADFRLTGPLRLLDPLLALAFRRIGDRALAGLQSSLDSLVRSA